MKFAICNEIFKDWGFQQICAAARNAGYEGIEIAPFTLGLPENNLSKENRQLLRSIASDNGIQIVGLHWLLANTEGYHIGHPDRPVREKTADYLISLINLCADIGGDIMVFGSPKQRSVHEKSIRFQAWEDSLDTFKIIIPALQDRGVTLCLEPLGPEETDFINTASEAVDMICELGSDNIQLILDVKAMSTEDENIPDIIRSNKDYLKHFHANDANRRAPGYGDTDFRPIASALKEIGYNGWVSVEVFDFEPDPVTIATDSINYLNKVFS